MVAAIAAIVSVKTSVSMVDATVRAAAVAAAEGRVPQDYSGFNTSQ